MKIIIPSENFTKVFYKIHKLKTRYVISYGGSGSSKSYSQAQSEIKKCFNTKQKLLIIRKVGDTLRDSVIALLKDVMSEWQISDIIYENKTDKTFFFPNGSKIVCRGFDDPEKIKSIHGVTRVWIEEANQLSEDDFKLLRLRIRGVKGIQFVLTFNPILEIHWLNSFFFKNQRHRKQSTIVHSSYPDNQFLDQAYIDDLEALKDLDYNLYLVYTQGKWGRPNVKRPFAYSFDQKRNVTKGLKLDFEETVYLSFDFNIDPITCIVCQHDYDYIRVIKEYRLQNSDIYELCDRINVDFKGTEVYFKVTGDASGQNRTAMTRGDLNYYKIIKEEIELNDSQFDLPTFNPSLNNSKVLLNALLLKHPEFIINESCKFLIDDLQYCEVNDKGELDKTKDKHRSHLLDCIRYYCNTYHIDLLNNNALARLLEK